MIKATLLTPLFAPLLSLAIASPVMAYGVASGGKTGINKSGTNAFSQPAGNLPMSDRLDFSVGNSFFRNPWVQAPASTDARDGLGPLFNTNGCQNCHIKDGRGHPPEEGEVQTVSMLIRLSVPASSDEDKKRLITQGNIPDPTYGAQLQDFAITGAKPEGKIQITYATHVETFSDGYTVELRKPRILISDLNYGPMSENVQLSARIAPPMIGLGLLEAIPDSQLLDWQDINDSNQDGISGKANQVWDEKQAKTVIGRFGWKAGQPTLMQQNAAAFNGDLGITSNIFIEENCTQPQTICQELPNGGSPEVSDKILNFVEFYSRHLAVPNRRDTDDKSVIQGQALFAQLGCDSCHKPKAVTKELTDLPALSKQTIHPYTDLLLHDMGEGLADNRGEFIANGQEWRTAPLWGIGYTQEVNKHTYFLHDGRARNLMEAVLWHGGEAQQSKEAVLKLNQQERDALIRFLESL
ncbi:di-heme oxidoreductase family protein [Vibrio comitans]|uniref:Thiol oxidoreductase n=1 Tax=Vibrio comitans NBRC 102076 TaxID=1219078 RepID=A0A4Y3IRU9_9VIBR|nr:di-heme oxidoredictase family protein [Vibrio comitans]GEA61480.1 thiol oxidoreductase [Vibrio comitans NBRC 102076]